MTSSTRNFRKPIQISWDIEKLCNQCKLSIADPCFYENGAAGQLGRICKQCHQYMTVAPKHVKMLIIGDSLIKTWKAKDFGDAGVFIQSYPHLTLTEAVNHAEMYFPPTELEASKFVVVILGTNDSHSTEEFLSLYKSLCDYLCEQVMVDCRFLVYVPLSVLHLEKKTEEEMSLEHQLDCHSQLHDKCKHRFCDQELLPIFSKLNFCPEESDDSRMLAFRHKIQSLLNQL